MNKDKMIAFATGLTTGFGAWLFWALVTQDGAAAVGYRLRSVLLAIFLCGFIVPAYYWITATNTGEMK